MKAVVFTGEGRVSVEDVPQPVVKEASDALVRITRSAICGSDLHLLSGKTPGMRPGGVIGHEFVGEVTEAGPEADVPEGSRVLGSFLIACGSCTACLSRRYNFCARRRALGLGTLTGDLDGAQAGYVRVPDASVNLKVLEGGLESLGDEEALFCGDVLATGVYAADLAEGPAGSIAAVIGAGPIGLFTAEMLRARGRRVLIVDTDPTRVEFAAGAGFESVEAADDAPRLMTEATRGEPVETVVEAVGSIAAFKTAMRCVGDGGRVVVIGVYGAERYELPMGMAWVRGLELRFGGMANVQATWDEALRAVRAGDIEPAGIITHRLPLERAEEGYELFAAREAMKVVLTP